MKMKLLPYQNASYKCYFYIFYKRVTCTYTANMTPEPLFKNVKVSHYATNA